MKNLFLGFFCISLLIACTKDSGPVPLGDDYLIFGEYYGECWGDCFVAYKIENNQLFEDDLDFFYRNDLIFKPHPLPIGDFEIARVLFNNFPHQLIDDGSSTYGCPDCGDQGGIYLQLGKDQEAFIWNIDTWDQDVPASIQAYRDKIMEVIRELN